MWLLYVQLLMEEKLRVAWAVMINPPEMAINDETRNEAHIASTGVRLQARNQLGTPGVAKSFLIGAQFF